MGRRVWFHEIWNFVFRDRREKNGPTLTQFWGSPQDAEEESMSAKAGIAKIGERPLADGRVTARVSPRDVSGRLAG